LRDEQVSDKDGLDIYFEIDAGCSHLARRCLEGPLSVVLLRLGQAYPVVEMRDDFVEFGPLKFRRKRFAADFDALIDALIALFSDSNDEGPVEPDLGEDAPFCFYCGFTVHPGTPVCPRCQGRLDDDPDENEDVV
jgi:hypothetical protein